MESAEHLANRVKLTDLRLLRAIVEHGSMVKAAQHLNLTQPAVSKALSAMERVLGVRLLDRGRGGISPTPYGEAMLSGGLAAFDEIRQSIARVQQLARPTKGVLRIGCTQPLALGFVPTVIDRMRRSYPETCFIIFEGDVVNALRQRRIDLAVARLAQNARAPDLQEDVLFDDPVRIVAGADNPLSRRRKLTFDDISGGPWVLPSYDTPVGSLIAEGFRAYGLAPPQPQVTTTSLTMQVGLLVLGHYLTMTARSWLRLNAWTLSLKVLPVPFDHSPSSVAITRLRNRTLTPLAEVFISHAKQVASSLSRA